MFSGCPFWFHSWQDGDISGSILPLLFQTSIVFLSQILCGYVTVPKSISNILCQKIAIRRGAVDGYSLSYKHPPHHFSSNPDVNFSHAPFGRSSSPGVPKGTFSPEADRREDALVAPESFPRKKPKYLNGIDLNDNPLKHQIMESYLTVFTGRGENCWWSWVRLGKPSRCLSPWLCSFWSLMDRGFWVMPFSKSNGFRE